jgi:hypothetical protein
MENIIWAAKTVGTIIKIKRRRRRRLPDRFQGALRGMYGSWVALSGFTRVGKEIGAGGFRFFPP